MLRDEISGTVDRTPQSHTITGSGTHTLMWEYEKESGDSDGSDCGWLDYLTWTGDTSPRDGGRALVVGTAPVVERY